MSWAGRFGLVWLALAGGAQAQEQVEIPTGFATCMGRQAAWWTRDHPPLAQAAGAGFDSGNFDWVAYCGMSGIVDCDLSEEPLDCQRALRVEQDAMSARILAVLPDPSVVAGRAGEWSDALYPRALALAKGQSAGQDCAGAGEAIEVWCEARESSTRLGLAVLAWQVARYLGAVEPAGWVAEPPPTRPQVRPGEGTR